MKRDNALDVLKNELRFVQKGATGHRLHGGHRWSSKTPQPAPENHALLARRLTAC